MDNVLNLPLSQIRFNISDWKLVNLPPQRFPNGIEYQQWVLGRELDDNNLLLLHILESEVEKPNTRPSMPSDEEIRNRDITDESRHAAATSYLRFYENSPGSIDPKGDHTIFLCGFSHYAITYTLTAPDVLHPIYFRKYVLSFTQNEKPVEIIVTCRIQGNYRKLSSEDFFQIIPMFDKFIYSADFQGKEAPFPNLKSTSIRHRIKELFCKNTTRFWRSSGG